MKKEEYGMEETKNPICPICQKEIGEQETIICPGCGTIYHKECWETSHGCCIETCSEYRKKQETTEQSVEASVETEPVEQELPTEQTDLKEQTEMVSPSFCQNCGSPIQESENFCSLCGHPVQPISNQFNPNAGIPVDGQPQPDMIPTDPNFIPPGVPPMGMTPQKKSKKKLVIILFIVLAILLIAGGIAGYFIYSSIQAEKEKQEAIAQYKEDAYSYYSAIVTNAYQVGMLGSDYVDYWDAYIDGKTYYEGHTIYDPDSAIAAAREDNADEISAIESTDGIIDDLYDNLTGELPDPEDEELQKIQQVVEEAQTSYDELYNTVIYISGSYITYISDLNQDLKDLNSVVEDMKSVIPNPNDTSSKEA